MKHTLKLPLNINKHSIFTEHGYDYREEYDFSELTPEQKQQALEVVNAYFTPLHSIEIIKLITRLQIISPEKDKTPIDLEARTSIWVEELRKYPADIVKTALKQKYRWFPALAEVLDYCDNEVAHRELIRKGLIYNDRLQAEVS